MDIVRVAVCFQLLHLIVGLSVDHCVELGDDEYKCLFKMSPANRQLSVQCSKYGLEMQVLDHNGENPSDENGVIPSLQCLWDTCMHCRKKTTVKKEPSNFHFRIQLNNGLKHLPDNYFCDVPSISWISISNTLLNDTRKLGFSSLTNCDSLCGPRLQHLDMEYNVFEKVLNNSFCGLDHLIMIDLANNEIKELESDAFINLKSLEILGLDFNSISVLPLGVFREQQNTLVNLFLDNNRLNSQTILELKSLKQLKVLSLSSNPIDVLPKDVFNHMTQLKHLDLGNTFIKTIQGSLSSLINLEHLSISVNRISVIHPNDFQNMVNLSKVDFSFNPITNVEPDFCANCTKVTNVQFSHALLTTVPTFISKSAQLKALDLSSNRIEDIDVGAFDAGQDIDLIDLSFNQLNDITNAFTKCTVKQLNLDHNRLTEFSFTDFSYKLINLSITHNIIHTIDTSHNIIPQTLWSLNMLNLSNNHLNEIADGSFDHLTMLSVLNLDHNDLRHISANIFNKMRSLTQLFLSHNKIKTIEPNAFPSQLQTLHLDNNQLLNFDVWQLSHLMNLTKLSVSGNRWSCDLSESLEEWLLNKSHIVEDSCAMVCEHPNGTVHRVSHLPHCSKTNSIKINEFNSENDANYANGVKSVQSGTNAKLYPWVLGLGIFHVIVLVAIISVCKRGAQSASLFPSQSVATLISEI